MRLKDYIKDAKGKEILVFSGFCVRETPETNETFCHTAHEISLLRGGSGVYTINDIDYEFEGDNIFIVPGNVSHKFQKIDKPVDFYNIYFEPRMIWDSNSFFDRKYLQVFHGDKNKYNFKLDRSNKNYGEVIELYEKIITEFTKKEDGYKHMVKALVLQLLVTIFRYFDYAQDKAEYLNSNIVAAVMRATDFIDTNFRNDISLEKIASAAGLSPKYFGSVFKKLNGITPWEYVTSKRINLAIDIVTSKEYSSMLSVAKMCGYHNTASFNKAFRKNTGVVPSKYISAIGEYEKSGEL